MTGRPSADEPSLPVDRVVASIRASIDDPPTVSPTGKTDSCHSLRAASAYGLVKPKEKSRSAVDVPTRWLGLRGCGSDQSRRTASHVALAEFGVLGLSRGWCCPTPAARGVITDVELVTAPGRWRGRSIAPCGECWRCQLPAFRLTLDSIRPARPAAAITLAACALSVPRKADEWCSGMRAGTRAGRGRGTRRSVSSRRRTVDAVAGRGRSRARRRIAGHLPNQSAFGV
jgi:hypothetical protein